MNLSIIQQYSAYTVIIHACTHTIAPSGSPEWLTVTCNHPTSVQVSWGAVPEDQRNGIITGYMIQVERPDTTRNIPTTGGYTTLKEVSDLKPSTEYNFNVSAVTIAGSGPAISVSFVMPQEGEASVHTIASMMAWYGEVLSMFKAYCVGGSKCCALPLYAVKLTKVRAMLITQDMVRAIRVLLLLHELCHRSYVQSNVYVCTSRLDGYYECFCCC